MKIVRLMQIIASHLILYLGVFLLFNLVVPNVGTTWFATFFWWWDTRYVSPEVRNITLLVMVIIVFPLVSIVYELERRKKEKKKQSDISTREKEIDR